MANSFNKREVEKKKQSKKLEKQQRKEERKANKGGSSLDDMIAYVDVNGVITNLPPDMQNKEEIDIENIIISTPKKEEMEDPVKKGRVEHFNSDKGYGFIKDIENTEKYFFHVSNAPEGITEGATVTFEIERGPKGMNAIKIELTK